MALTPVGMGVMFAGYGFGLTGWCWITGRDISLGQLWNPLHPVTKLPAAGTASPDVIIPNGQGGGTTTTGTTQNALGGTQTTSGGGGTGSTNPLSGGLTGGSSGAAGTSSGGATLTASETATGSGGGESGTAGTGGGGGGTKATGVSRTTTPRSSGSGGEAGIGSPSGGGGGGGGAGAAAPLPSGGSGGVTPADIYRELIKQGATPVQAAGIMGSIQNESGFNPDVRPGDNGTSYGLFQEHNKAGTPPYTGNLQKDMVAQIRFMIANGGLKEATGSTPAEVASNFAHGYEACAACGYQGGTSQLAARSANAVNIYAQATKGNWGAQPPAQATVPANFPGGLKAWANGGWQAYYKKLFGVWPPGYKPPAAGPKVLGRVSKSGKVTPATAGQVSNAFGIVRPARGHARLAPKAKAPAGVRHLPPALTKPAAAAKAQGRVNPQSVASRY